MSSKLDGRRSITAEAAEAPVMASAAVRNWGIRTMVVVLVVLLVVVVLCTEGCLSGGVFH